MADGQGYTELIVWQRAMDLIVVVHEIIRQLPPDEKFAITDQMRRAALSVACNIAEGHAKNSTRSFTNYLNIARGSLAELHTLILTAHRLQYIQQDATAQTVKHIAEVQRLSYRLIQSLRNK